jgi:hypothetical protein
MKLNDLIAQLQGILEQHGDITPQVEVMGGWYDILDVKYDVDPGVGGPDDAYCAVITIADYPSRDYG